MSGPACFLAFPALAAAFAPVEQASWRFHADGVLGTRLDIAIGCASPILAQLAADAALTEIARLDRILSRWEAGSELSGLNRASRMVVSPDLFAVLARAAHWREVSGGAFDERLGEANRLWRLGEAEAAMRAVEAARHAGVSLEPETRLVMREAGAVLDLDAIAKGYVIDRALAALRAASGEVTSALVTIGGDIAGWRADGGAWRIGLPQAGDVSDNSQLAAVVELGGGAIASSGRGLRDVMTAAGRVGPAISPLDGRPAAGRFSVSARAASAMDADALATIGMVLAPDAAMALADTIPDAAMRIAGEDGSVRTSLNWRDRQAPPRIIEARQSQPGMPQTTPLASGVERWPIDWRLAIWYKLPERRKRDPEFREPYMAVWISDAAGEPIRTLFMVGGNAKWQRDNYIWWGKYRARAEEIIDARSELTAPTGRYAFMWDGYDDNDRRVTSGAYTIHIETSRERGGHTHRTMPIEITAKKFQKTMAPLPEEGGFIAFFGHYNDVVDFEPDD